MIFCTTSSTIKIQKAITFVFFLRFFNSLLGGGVATTTLPQDLRPQNHITQQHSFHKLPYLPQQSVDHSKDLEREIQISYMCLSNSNLFQFEHIKLQIYISKELNYFMKPLHISMKPQELPKLPFGYISNNRLQFKYRSKKHAYPESGLKRVARYFSMTKSYKQHKFSQRRKYKR